MTIENARASTPVSIQTSEAATALTQRRLSGRESWWRHYEEAKAFKVEHGHLRFPARSALAAWQKNAREVWSRGSLDDDQIAGLKALGVKINSNVAVKRGGADAGKKIDHLLELKAKINKGQASEVEIAEEQHLMDYYRDRYRRDQLSRTIVHLLGFNTFMP